MPMYEYQCAHCGHRFELLVRSMSAGKAKARCPQCGRNGAARQFSTFGVGAGGAEPPGCNPQACSASCPASGTCPMAQA